MVLDSWYKRYELSNFSLWWKSSIHNRVYREMWDYVWIWTSASSFIKSPNSELKKYLWISKDSLALRWTNTSQVANYNKWEFLDRASVQTLTEKDLLIEEFFLALRTDIWVNDLQKFSSVLVKNIDQKIDSYIQQWFVQKTSNWIVLTDPGMDIYNDIITELLEEI
jgi:coproporphyrinogen III oxidase-like Fe-S oxidoreductase